MTSYISKSIQDFAIPTLCIAVTVACSNKASDNSISQSEINQLKQRISALEIENANLKLTPANLLESISSEVKKQNLQESKKLLADMISKYPLSPEKVKAEVLVKNLEQKLIRDAQEAERIKRLGFKAIHDNSRFESESMIVQIKSLGLTNYWAFNDYGHEHNYRRPSRDNILLVGHMAITSKDKGSNLPGLYVGSVNGDSINIIGEFQYEFARWKDYATYLGNYSDHGNDFDYTATIPFSAGIEISVNQSKQPLAIIATKNRPITRRYERFKNPPEWYETNYSARPSTVTLEDMKTGKYHLLKYLNLK